MKYEIKRGNATVALIQPEGTVSEKIMGEESVNISFTYPSKIDFHIDDKITIYGKDYFLSGDPVTVKNNSREFQYTLIFFSVKYQLSDWNVLFYDNENALTIPDFSIMGTASKCLDIVIANANRANSGWTKGIVDETEVKNVSFSDSNCLEAISKIAEEFKLEYWIDSDKSIHLTERKPVSGYSFEYGKAKGLKNITRSVLEGGRLVTRLSVKGGDKNLPKNYRAGQKNLRIDVPYLEKNIDIYGVKEHTETFPEIYPKRTGTVTAVDAADPNRFTDADLDFDLNSYNEYGTTVLLAGVAAKIIFQSGQLAGYTLELTENGGFDSATKTFYLNIVKDEKNLQVPSDLLRPAIGDKYIIVDIMMPETYVLAAEAELKAEAQKYINDNSKERFQYACEGDIIYFKNQNINIALGSTANFKDLDFKLDDAIRVTGLTKNVQNKYDVKFDLSEVTAVSSIVKSYYEQQEQTNTIIKTIKYNAELARRSYLFGREFHDKVFDGEGYFDAENIKPLSIETKMISLGSRLQQFGLPGVDFKVQNNIALLNTAGKIVHETIDAAAVREWNIAANSVMPISANFNYIYIKCQKNGINASFVVTEAQIKIEQVQDFYHFEVGYLSSVIDNYRKIKTTYGFAQLNPAELSIGKISDPSGNNYINLQQDRIAIKAKVEFTSDSPALINFNNAISQSQLDSINAAKSYSDAQDVLYDIFFRAYADGVVSEEEQRAIADATAKANAARLYAAAQDELLRVQIEAYADGIVTEAEQDSINLAQANLQAAKDYADAQAALSNIINQAYADGIVSAEEQRAIDDAQAKLDLAKAHAQGLVNNIQIGGRNLLINSKIKIESSDYLFARFEFSEKLIAGENYVFRAKIDSTNDDNFNIYQNNGNDYLGGATKQQNGFWELKFTAVESYINLISVYNLSGGVVKHYYSKLEKGNKATDWTPAPEDVQAQIDEVASTATIVNQLLIDIADDSKLTPSEKQSLLLQYNPIIAEFPQISAQAGTYGIPIQRTAYINSYNNLIAFVNPLISNLNTTSNVNGETLRGYFSNYFTAKVVALKAITDAVSDNLGSIYAEMNDLRDDLQNEISDVNNSINDLEGYIEGSFSDGVISKAEAVAIEKYKNQINTEKTDLENKYIQIYGNSVLTGIPKTDLATAWTAYQNSHIDLIASINNAISDGNTTPAEKADVDAKFLNYRNSFGNLTTKFQNAISAIEKANIDNIHIGGRNLLINSKIKIESSDYLFARFEFSEKLIAGENYVFRAKIDSTNDEAFNIYQNNGNDYLGGATKQQNGFWELKFTAVESYINLISVYNLSGGVVKHHYSKLEKGNKATDWTPAPEDVQAQITANATISANALAQAQNAQNTASNTAAVTSFLSTNINGNVVSTGTMQIGSATGANGGITGVIDKGLDSVALWFGSDYANRNTAPFRVTQSGKIAMEMRSQANNLQGLYLEEGNLVWRDNSGRIRRSIGWSNGFPLDKSYSNSGVLIYEFNEYGFHSYAIPDGFTPQEFFKINSSNINELPATLIALIEPSVIKSGGKRQYNNPETGTVEFYWEYALSLNKNFDAWYYQAGNVDANNLQYQGYKINNTDKTANITAGWYISNLGELGREVTNGGNQAITVYLSASFIESGKIIKTISFQITK